ncbi:MAG: redoxin family protein [Phycisphaerales bacterium JB038]
MLRKNPLHTTLLSAIGATALLIAGIAVNSASAQASRSGNQTKLVVGEEVPDFTLTDTEGNEHKLSDLLEDEKVVVLEWFNPGCPFVVRHHSKASPMKEAYEAYKDQEEKQVVWLAINSGAPGKQGHGAELNQRKREEWKIEYPILIDESGEVGRAYGAKTTPHMYVIAADGKLLYQGAIDNDPRGRNKEATNYVLEALNSHFGDEEIETTVTRPYGCGVKYSR